MPGKILKLSIITFFLIGLNLNGRVFAQSGKSEEDDFLLSSKEKANKDYTLKVLNHGEIPNSAGNNATVSQSGKDHKSIIDQVYNGKGNPNVAIIMQHGNQHESVIRQEGSGNTNIVDQRGSHNFYEGYVNGDDNTIHINQRGSYNNIEHELSGSDKMIEYTQKGNGNNIILDNYGSHNAPPQIIQEGHNMNLKIEVR